MVDVISGGRLIAGLPVGTPMDATLCYGIPPLEQRERYYESHDLILKAWTDPEPFPWNGKYFQLPCVNTWPKPIQQPHPPIWVPGTASPSTWDFCAKYGYGYMVLTAFSGRMGITDSFRLIDGFWERVEMQGKPKNPYQAGIALIPIVGESMAQLERDYTKHLDYFFNGTLHIAPEHLSPPGFQNYATLLQMSEMAGKVDQTGGALDMFRFDGWTFKDFVDRQIVIAGTADEVAEQIESLMVRSGAGHLMTMMQFGSMPHELTRQNIEAFAEGVIPRLRPVFEDTEWENHWWPERLRSGRVAAGQGVA